MLIEWIEDNWEIIMGTLLGGSGVMAWIYRWFENRAERKETVANQAMGLLSELRQELNRHKEKIDALEQRDVEKSAIIEAMQKEQTIMEQWVNILVNQLREAGIKPAVKPGTETEYKRPPSRGFSP